MSLRIVVGFFVFCTFVMTNIALSIPVASNFTSQVTFNLWKTTRFTSETNIKIPETNCVRFDNLSRVCVGFGLIASFGQFVTLFLLAFEELGSLPPTSVWAVVTMVVAFVFLVITWAAEISLLTTFNCLEQSLLDNGFTFGPSTGLFVVASGVLLIALIAYVIGRSRSAPPKPPSE